MLAKDAFLTLVRLGIETEDASTANTQSLRGLSQKDWVCIRDMSEKQGVSAIVMDGLSRLVEKYGKDGIAPNIDSGWWQMYVLEGTGSLLQTEQSNDQQLQVMDSLASKWAGKGCKVMVFKGQASATMYPKPEHRSPGDIDCYLFENYAKGNEIAREVGAEVDEEWYKHSQIFYQGETFENHQYFVHTRDGKRGKRLQKALVDELTREPQKFQPLTKSSVIPPMQWTAMFLTYHACAHFVSEGLRLKQILDWAMLLEKHQNDVDWKQFYVFCERCHLKRFADAATAICVNYLGVKVSNPDITTDSSFAEKILDSALYDDDYVFGSGEGSWHNRWHLVKNLFRYRWKYEDIYEESVWRQLWFYASGYLFHTE
ncbi:nucleotidyltransferase family protein [uncultured Prevotella sp.]|uniref:nucleotidyltransferase family protein n=1 Tax=uncultured Prevotella sp. TaxID=159272 RepID=UPI0025F0DE94|nr:nucleotidyltransferase family protein [uncultured Prevotella sp.]